ncbi:TPA: ribonuclease III [Streptococcus suis]|uniref:ribonuclease III n=1 Tax=Streptococcus suis TaxID=1307 RepID=UPI0005BE1660|nr:ribonuclease III [Streptococcus suis]MCQ8270641.1 ribonuclease III [Streptococcus suis]MDW8719547.1 ribonuclease III [Streptococcus suis]MDY7595499.1 ribonuclease III [Streptococcus suis]MDY7599705.1 ribonuclease III [Streptococcus suis]NQH41271.1 ribonuclease III [Streptococcus suis]
MKDLHAKLLADFGIDFSDLNLLEMAFTHTSYANEHRLLKISHNERLEFLGDAVLQLMISKYLYQKYPDSPEGEMSKLRSTFVREESLAGFSRACGFDRFLRLGKGEEKSGGRNRDTILGDAFEAFLGALLLDKGEKTVEEFIHKVMIPRLEKGNFERVTDYKTALQEILQVNGEIAISYQVIAESGPAHDKTFEVEVSADQRVIGRGRGRSKKLAEQAAAKNAVEARG